MNIQNLEGISALEWLDLLEDRYASPQFQHINKEISHGGTPLHSKEDLIQNGMSSAEAELRLEAESQALAQKKALSDLDKRIGSINLELQELLFKKNQLVLDVYVRNENNKTEELDKVNGEISSVENVKRDIELAKQLTERFFNSILLRIDSQIGNIIG